MAVDRPVAQDARWRHAAVDDSGGNAARAAAAAARRRSRRRTRGAARPRVVSGGVAVAVGAGAGQRTAAREQLAERVVVGHAHGEGRPRRAARPGGARPTGSTSESGPGQNAAASRSRGRRSSAPGRRGRPRRPASRVSSSPAGPSLDRVDALHRRRRWPGRRPGRRRCRWRRRSPRRAQRRQRGVERASTRWARRGHRLTASRRSPPAGRPVRSWCTVTRVPVAERPRPERLHGRGRRGCRSPPRPSRWRRGRWPSTAAARGRRRARRRRRRARWRARGRARRAPGRRARAVGMYGGLETTMSKAPAPQRLAPRAAAPARRARRSPWRRSVGGGDREGGVADVGGGHASRRAARRRA